MNEKYLPIGTVVLLKDGNKKVMIISYLIFTNGETKKMFDYGGCTFPEGVIESDYAVGFNHDDIAEVIHLGLQDDEQKDFIETLLAAEDEIKKKVETDMFNNPE